MTRPGPRLTRLGPIPILIWLDLDSDWLWSTKTRVDYALGLGPTTLDLVLGDSARHGLEPTRLDMGQAQFKLIWVWDDSTRYGPRPTRLNLGPSKLGSTWGLVNLVKPGIRPTQLDMGLGLLGLTWLKLTQLTWARCRLGHSSGPFGSIWAWTHLTEQGLRLYQLNMHLPNSVRHGPDQFGSTWAWSIRLDMGPIDSTRHGPKLIFLYIGPHWLNTGHVHSCQHGPGLTRLDMGPDWLGSTSTRIDFARHRPTILDSTWMQVELAGHRGGNATWLASHRLAMRLASKMRVGLVRPTLGVRAHYTGRKIVLTQFVCAYYRVSSELGCVLSHCKSFTLWNIPSKH